MSEKSEQKIQEGMNKGKKPERVRPEQKAIREESIVRILLRMYLEAKIFTWD